MPCLQPFVSYLCVAELCSPACAFYRAKQTFRDGVEFRLLCTRDVGIKNKPDNKNGENTGFVRVLLKTQCLGKPVSGWMWKSASFLWESESEVCEYQMFDGKLSMVRNECKLQILFYCCSRWSQCRRSWSSMWIALYSCFCWLELVSSTES